MADGGAKKKVHPLVWVGLGCGGLVLMGFIVLVIAGVVFYQSSDVSRDPGRMVDRVNIGPFRKQANRIAEMSFQTIEVTHCQMAPEASRRGYCLLQGAAGDLRGLPSVMALEQMETERLPTHGGCSDWLKQHEGATQWKPNEASKVPTNHDNVKLGTLWIDDGELCLDLSYPYG